MERINVACVWVGRKYGVEYVERLHNMVKRHLPVPHRFLCYTDNSGDVPRGVHTVDVSGYGWNGWWSKICLFYPSFRGPWQTLYFDLDTVIVDDLTRLAEWRGDFGICQNFTKLRGHPTWPCNYGSCVMSISAGFGYEIAQPFEANAEDCMARYPRGDQHFIEDVYPNASFLQDEMPPNYFLHYKDFGASKPERTSLVIFGGRSRPDNCNVSWVRNEWK